LAQKIIEGLGEYRYIGKKPPDLKELFPEGGELIQLLEAELVKMPSRDDPHFTLPGRPAELLRQIYTHFRNLEELDRFAQQSGERHPWAYEDLVQAYAKKQDWQKVYFWASRGLNGKGSKNKRRNAILADYKAQAAEQLGDRAAVLSSLWDAFNSEADVERYMALRKAAKAQGRWGEYYPRLVQRLTHNVSGSSIMTGHLWDNRLLVEAFLVEGEYERALEQAIKPRFTDYWDEKGNAQKSVIGFFLHSVTRAVDRDAAATKYPEIAKRLSKPPEFIERLKEELFQERLPEPDRDRQIAWVVQMIRPRIDQIVGGKCQGAYADAARDAQLITELYRFQGQSNQANSFIAGLHAQYQRHRNFRAELKKLGLGSK
jgi:predicted XRE-type DNA-binding protein